MRRLPENPEAPRGNRMAKSNGRKAVKLLRLMLALALLLLPGFFIVGCGGESPKPPPNPEPSPKPVMTEHGLSPGKTEPEPDTRPKEGIK